MDGSLLPNLFAVTGVVVRQTHTTTHTTTALGGDSAVGGGIGDGLGGGGRPAGVGFKFQPPPSPVVAVSFDLFGTLVRVDRSGDPGRAVADELAARDVRVPADWEQAYREPHIDAPAGAEVPLPAHVAAALRSRGVEASGNAARRAVVAAFDPEVERCEGAERAVAAARERGPVGIMSNTSVPELARRCLIRADLGDAFDVVVTSIGCGWRKPDARAFDAVANRLGVSTADLVHVGDDPDTDGGVAAAGGRFVDVGETPLPSLSAWLEAYDAGRLPPDDGDGGERGNGTDWNDGRTGRRNGDGGVEP
jgi:FMN phosphatase YigB (HAD superfamily)